RLRLVGAYVSAARQERPRESRPWRLARPAWQRGGFRGAAGSGTRCGNTARGRQAPGRWQGADAAPARLYGGGQDDQLRCLLGLFIEQECRQYSSVDAFEALELHHFDILVHLVDAGVDRAQFHDLRARGRDKASVTGAATSGQLWHKSHLGVDAVAYGPCECAFLGEEGVARQLPFERVVLPVAIEYGM